MKITQSGNLVELDQKSKIKQNILITDQTRVQYKNQKLVIDDKIIIPAIDKQFVYRLDQAIKSYQLKLQYSIQQFICNRQEIIKINFTNRKLATRYIWISDNYAEIRYADNPYSKAAKKIFINEVQFQYEQKDPKLLKTLQKHKLNSEYVLSIIYKKKSLDVNFISFLKLNSFIFLCNWILRNRDLKLVKYSSMIFLKLKLKQAADREQIPVKKYLLQQLNRIQTRYTLKVLSQLPSQQQQQQSQQSQQSQQQQKLTIKKIISDKENLSSVVKKFQFTD